MATKIASLYMPAPATVVVLPYAMVGVTLTQAVAAERAGKVVTGTITTAGAKPAATFAQAVGPGRVRIKTTP